MPNKRNSRQAADEVRAAQNRDQAVDLKKAGHTYREIAQALGVSLAAAHGYVKQAVADLAEHTLEETEDMRRLENERLDAIQSALWDLRWDPKRATVLISISRQRAAINGLNRPTEVKVTGDMAAEYDLSKLTDEQAKAFAAALAILDS